MASKALEHRFKEITTTFHTFVENQVLTEVQLNEFLRYFDDQDGLTRIALSGVGVACGLEPKKLNVTDSNGFIQKQLEISKGFGVTTDGDLLYLGRPGSKELEKDINYPSFVFTNYRRFEDTEIKYPYFQQNGSQIEIWEAIPSSEVSNVINEPLLTNLLGFDDMVVLLYLEWYEDDNGLCDELSCDSQGKLRGARLRVLLVSQANAAIITSKDEVYTKHDLMATYQQMNDVTVPRVILGNVLTGSGNTATAAQLTGAYNLLNFSSAVSGVTQGLNLMQGKLAPHFPTHGIGDILTGITNKLPVAGATPSVFFQYRYDLLKDVVDAYNELKEAFIKISTECFPSITAFPKHLMLGKLDPTENDKLISRFRHKFYRSPILAESPEFEVFKSLLKRLKEIISGYPNLPETAANTGLLRTRIKITPSNYRSELGSKAIPFYYNLTDELLKVWSFDKTAVGKYRRNLSYNTQPLDQIPQILNPLRFNLEPFPFFRIEGHQGRDYREVLTRLDELKRENALSFDVKALCVDVDNNYVIDPAEYECEFEDLSMLLKAWVDEQQCGIAKATSLLSSYSIAVPQYNFQEEVYTAPIGVFYEAPSFNVKGTEIVRDGQIDLEKSDSQAAMKKGAAMKEPDVAAKKTDSMQSSKETAIKNNKVYYEGKTTVIDNLTPKEDAIGGAFIYALNNQPNGKPNDLFLAASYYFDEYVKEKEITWDKDIKVILVDNTFHLLSYLQALSNSIPLSVAQINDTVISRYTTNINNLCSTLQKVQVSYTDSTKLTTKNRAVLGLLINQLSVICCAAKQLQALLKEIDDRKDAILQRLTLKKFVEQHPGLEHLGGVENGGTFVIVYLRKGNNVVGGVQNTPNGTVLADFSLPYMCCSDCAPVNFIVPRANVSLKLPKDVVCLGSDIEVLVFDADPADGLIKADQEITGMSIADGKLTINPLTFDKTKLNQVIKFTVNDQVTNCQLVVKEPLQADFEVPESPVMNTLVAFEPSGSYPADAKFEWSFGDGNVSSQKEINHNYVLPLTSGSNTVEVTLKVSPADGACPTIVKKSVEFAPVKISLSEESYCNNDSGVYSFTITPTGANPALSGPGVNAVNRTFSPLGLIPGTTTILMNGVPSLTTQIIAQPTVVMDANIVGTNLVLSSNLTSSMAYKWTFTDITGKTQVRPAITNNANPTIPLSEFPTVGQGDSFLVALNVDSICGAVKREKIMQMPVITINVSLPKTSFCNNDATVYPFTITPAGAVVTLAGPGVDNNNKTFRAFGLNTGNSNISVNGEIKLRLLISAPPVLPKFTIETNETEIRLNAAIPPESTFAWSFTNSQGVKLRADITNTASPIVRSTELKPLVPGELIFVRLTVTNSCGSTTQQTETRFTQPSSQGSGSTPTPDPTPTPDLPTNPDGNLNACQTDAAEDIGRLKMALENLTLSSVSKFFNQTEKQFFIDFGTLLSTIIKDPLIYLNGTQNSLVFDEMFDRLEAIKTMVFNANPETAQLFYDLYKLNVSLLYSIVQCQADKVFIKNVKFTNLAEAINSLFNPQNPDNFKTKGVEIDREDKFRMYLQDISDLRKSGYVFDKLELLISHIV